MNGIVSTDRKNGYYRFIFAKPIDPIVYYAEVFAVYMVGVLAAMLILSGLLRMLFPAFSILNFLLYAPLIYIAMGGIGFFLSVATRFAWLCLAGVRPGSRFRRGLCGPERDRW